MAILPGGWCFLTHLNQLLQATKEGIPGDIFLAAISVGAVSMGANTYIGSGPDFMVKAIAEEAGIKMPSFFGYVKYYVGILLPLFVVVTLVFFRPQALCKACRRRGFA